MGRRHESAADDLAAEIVELATTLEDERPAATRADTAAAAAAARAHDAQARRGDVVDAAVIWSKKQSPASEELQQLIAAVDAHYDGWVAPRRWHARSTSPSIPLALLSAAVGRVVGAAAVHYGPPKHNTR